MYRTVPKNWASETLATEALKNVSETVSAGAEQPTRPQKSAAKRRNFRLSRIAKKVSYKKALRWRSEQAISNQSLAAVPCSAANNRVIRALAAWQRLRSPIRLAFSES